MYNFLLTFVTTNVMMHTMQYRHHRYRMVVVVAQRTDNGRDTCVRENDFSLYSRNTRRIFRRLRRCPEREYVERNASLRTNTFAKCSDDGGTRSIIIIFIIGYDNNYDD